MPFAPTDLSNLAAWYRADAGVTGTGTNVTAWNDQSGNGRHLSLTNPLYPLQIISNAQNSLPALRSLSTSGTYGAMTRAAFPALTNGTIYAVVQHTLADASINNGVTQIFQSANNFSVGRHQLAAANSIYVESTTGFNLSAPINNGTFYTVRLRLTAGNMYLSVNNGTEVSIARSGTPSASDIFFFGDGDKYIAEAIFYSDSKTGNDSDLVEYHLQQKYLHYTWTGSVPTQDVTAVITFPALPTKTVGDAPFAAGATSNSPAAITYTSSNLSVATVSGSTITIVGAGTSTITASQNATTGYTAATPVARTLTVNAQSQNNNNMATNHIDGELVGLFVSTVLTSPQASDWKEVVCGMNVSVEGSADVTSKRTKCGVIKSTGPASWTISGTGTHNTAPGTNKISADAMVGFLNNGTDVLVRALLLDGSTTLMKRQAPGKLSRYTDSFNTGEPGEFEFTFELIGNVDASV